MKTGMFLIRFACADSIDEELSIMNRRSTLGRAQVGGLSRGASGPPSRASACASGVSTRASAPPSDAGRGGRLQPTTLAAASAIESNEE